VTSSVLPVNQTNEGRAAEKKERPRRERPAAPDLPKDLDDTSMSAMELAFAMAGAQADLVEDEDESETKEQDSK
jgi:hypothetical protein